MVILTNKGYGFFEASSAFQKAIRRSEEETAMYFMVELYNSGYEEYLWKRIKIIASEDVGLADPTMPVIIAALYQNYSDQKKDNKEGRPERIFLAHAVLALSRAWKSRFADYNVIHFWRTHDEKKLDIPDYAFDKHTLKGKQMGRGLDHFYEEGAKITNDAKIPGEPEMKQNAYDAVKKYPGKMKFTNGNRGKKTITLFDEDQQATE